MLAQGPDIAPILGMERVRYLEGNLSDASIELTEADLKAWR
ncbi:MAG: hypothetical protein ABIN90_04470 [Knoellia sp.]